MVQTNEDSNQLIPHKLSERDALYFEMLLCINDQQVVLFYLSVTSPDLTYAISVVSQYMHSPSAPHLEAIRRILPHQKLAHKEVFQPGHMKLEAFTDVDQAGAIDDWISTRGHCIFVCHKLVLGEVKTQSVAAKSSIEAEQ